MKQIVLKQNGNTYSISVTCAYHFDKAAQSKICCYYGDMNVIGFIIDDWLTPWIVSDINRHLLMPSRKNFHHLSRCVDSRGWTDLQLLYWDGNVQNLGRIVHFVFQKPYFACDKKINRYGASCKIDILNPKTKLSFLTCL